MNSKSRHVMVAISLFVVFAITQVCIGASFAGSALRVPARNFAIASQQPNGVLATSGIKEVTVNGATATGGATILSGATIQTPAAGGASVKLGSRGSVEIAPGTKIALEFNQTSVKVMLFQGCVILHLKQGIAGEIDTSQGVADKTESIVASTLNVCFPTGATAPIINAGTAGVGVGTAGGAAGSGGLFGLGTAATVAIVGGAVATAVIIPVALRGGNPSPSSP
jgi:hypothetical protein